MDGRVVELYPLTDPDRPRPEDDDGLPGSARRVARLAVLVVRGIVVGSLRVELAAARIDDAEDRLAVAREGITREGVERGVGVAEFLALEIIRRVEREARDPVLKIGEPFYLRYEERIDTCDL